MALPIQSPAQAVKISPEALEVANTYLSTQNIQATATQLGIPAEQVTEILERREVQSYVDNVFMDSGFNNRFRLREVMDAIISKKLQELDEAEVGSGKDIADLLALSHKMSMDMLSKQIELEKIRSSSKVQNQTNIQVNEYGGSYGNLIQKLMGVEN